jgi:hypothetical protein
VRKLFVSYSRNDKAVAQRVAHALSTQGYDVFWDAEIPPGQKFDTYIFSQLEQSDAVIVLWSTSSITSDYVKEEAEYAKMNSVLVPVRIDEVALPFGFTRIHTTDLLHWHGSIQDPDWRRIVRAIDSSIAQAFTAKAHCRRTSLLRRRSGPFPSRPSSLGATTRACLLCWLPSFSWPCSWVWLRLSCDRYEAWGDARHPVEFSYPPGSW